MKKENGVINIRASRPITEDQVELRRALIEKASRPLGRVRQEHDPAAAAAATAADVAAAVVAGSARKANRGRAAQPGRRNPRTAKGKRRRVKAPPPDGLSDISDDDNAAGAEKDEEGAKADGADDADNADAAADGAALSARARRLRSRANRAAAAQGGDGALPPQFGPEDDPALPVDAQILAVLAVRTTERPREEGEEDDEEKPRPKVRWPHSGPWGARTAG